MLFAGIVAFGLGPAVWLGGTLAIADADSIPSVPGVTRDLSDVAGAGDAPAGSPEATRPPDGGSGRGSTIDPGRFNQVGGQTTPRADPSASPSSGGPSTTPDPGQSSTDPGGGESPDPVDPTPGVGEDPTTDPVEPTVPTEPLVQIIPTTPTTANDPDLVIGLLDTVGGLTAR